MADRPDRVEIGFGAGQVLAARLTEEQLKKLRSALEEGGWHDISTEDGDIAIHLGQIVFLRTHSSDHRIGFTDS